MTAQCEHIKKGGVRCNGRAMRGHRLCGPHVGVKVNRSGRPRKNRVDVARDVDGNYVWPPHRSASYGEMRLNVLDRSPDGPWLFETVQEREAWLVDRRNSGPARRPPGRADERRATGRDVSPST